MLLKNYSQVSFKNAVTNIQEVLLTHIEPTPQYEGSQIALQFIETKEGYKFFGYSTIP